VKTEDTVQRAVCSSLGAVKWLGWRTCGRHPRCGGPRRRLVVQLQVVLMFCPLSRLIALYTDPYLKTRLRRIRLHWTTAHLLASASATAASSYRTKARHKYRYKGRVSYICTHGELRRLPHLRDMSVPFDRPEACVRGLEPWRGSESEMFDDVSQS
jgi:hypothetical protein